MTTLNELTLAQLVDVHNMLVGQDYESVKSFASKAKGVTKIQSLLKDGVALDIVKLEDGSLDVALVDVEVVTADGSAFPPVEVPTTDEDVPGWEPAVDDGEPGTDEKGGGSDDGTGEEPEEWETEEGEEPAFVKLSKDQLPARGTPEREAYRKARRAAARAARKARAAA